jgi:hypothetical protein
MMIKQEEMTILSESHKVWSFKSKTFDQPSTGILILHGQNDTQTPIEQAFLMQQRQTDVNHPDHTLITYPNMPSIHHLIMSLKLDLYNQMSWQIFMHGLNLILGLRILLLLCPLLLTLLLLND